MVLGLGLDRCIYIYMYILRMGVHMHIYIYGTPPPKDLVFFDLFAALLIHIILFLTHQHLMIISSMEYGGFKIKDSPGLLGSNLGSWIRHIEIQYGFNISIWPESKIPPQES